jgi:hypothetical protein
LRSPLIVAVTSGLFLSWLLHYRLRGFARRLRIPNVLVIKGMSEIMINHDLLLPCSIEILKIKQEKFLAVFCWLNSAARSFAGEIRIALGCSIHVIHAAHHSGQNCREIDSKDLKGVYRR